MKTKLGLNEKVTFGRYEGELVSEVIKKNAIYFKYRFQFLNEEAQKAVFKKLNIKPS